MHFKAWKTDVPDWSFNILNIQNYVQSLAKGQTLTAYTENQFLRKVGLIPRACHKHKVGKADF